MKKIWYAPYKFESYGEEEIKAVEESLRSGWLGGQGPKSLEFEEKIAKRFGKKYGVFVNSGSSACLLAIASLDLPKGCKIITPACTFSTTLAPIIQLGYIPKFVDVGLNDYVAVIEQVLDSITSDVKAIMLPNLIGNKIGLHPVWIIFGLFFFGTLFGIFGVIFAVPLTAMCAEIIKYLISNYNKNESRTN